MAKSKTSKRYTREFRQELVALHRAGRSIPELSHEFGPTPWTIALWVKQADRDGGRGDGGLTYLRLSSMIGWMAVCPRHQTVLLMQCPGCQVSLRQPPPASTRAFSKLLPPMRCRTDQRRRAQAHHPWVLRLQAVLLAAKREGATELEGIGRLGWPQLLALADVLSEMVWAAIGSTERHALRRRIGYQMNTPLIQNPHNWNDRYGSLALLAGLPEAGPIAPLRA